MTDDKIVTVIKKYFKNIKNIQLVYLFGSSLKRKNFCDIDIAVLFDEKINKSYYPKLKLQIISDLIDLLKFNNIDVVVLNNLEDYLLAYQIVTKGVVVYKKSKYADVRYKAKVFSLYLDFKFFIDKQFEKLQKIYGR